MAVCKTGYFFKNCSFTLEFNLERLLSDGQRKETGEMHVLGISVKILL